MHWANWFAFASSTVSEEPAERDGQADTQRSIESVDTWLAEAGPARWRKRERIFYGSAPARQVKLTYSCNCLNYCLRFLPLASHSINLFEIYVYTIQFTSISSWLLCLAALAYAHPMRYETSLFTRSLSRSLYFFTQRVHVCVQWYYFH